MHVGMSRAIQVVGHARVRAHKKLLLASAIASRGQECAGTLASVPAMLKQPSAKSWRTLSAATCPDRPPRDLAGECGSRARPHAQKTNPDICCDTPGHGAVTVSKTTHP